MTTEFEFSTTKRIVCKNGSCEALADYCKQLGFERPMIVTDQGIINAGLLDVVTDSLRRASIEFSLYADVVADPPESTIHAAVNEAKSTAIDGIIGFGGGSSLDTAKLVAALCGGKQTLDEMYGVDQVSNSRLPLILIPTTAGTGSEVTPVAIVTTGETTKAGVVSPVLLPDIALLDGTLTLSVPPSITAATGIDAMVHAIEAFTSKIRKNVYSDLLALKALRLLSSNIRGVINDPTDANARQQMLLGSCLAGQAFANAPVAAVHALAYPLGGRFHIPHGLSNALVLIPVMRFNMSACAAQYAGLAESLNIDVSGLSTDEHKANAVIEYLEGLIASLPLAQTLSECDIEEDDLPLLASDAMLQTRLLINNPREVSEADALMIYQQAFGG